MVVLGAFVGPGRIAVSLARAGAVLAAELSLPGGEGALAANLVIARIVLFHVDDAVLDATGRVDQRALDTIARVGGDGYVRTTDLFAMPRPQRRDSK